MAQITLYLDDATQALADQAAKAASVSKSQWVEEAIRQYAAHEWPQNCLSLAGRFADLSLREDVAEMTAADLQRVDY